MQTWSVNVRVKSHNIKIEVYIYFPKKCLNQKLHMILFYTFINDIEVI